MELAVCSFALLVLLFGIFPGEGSGGHALESRKSRSFTGHSSC